MISDANRSWAAFLKYSIWSWLGANQYFQEHFIPGISIAVQKL